MAYSHASQIAALRDMGVDAVLLGSDDWMLGSLTTIPRVAVFQGTSGPARRIRRGFAYLASLARLLRLIRRHPRDVVHWQHLELPIADLGAMLAIRLMGVAQVAPPGWAGPDRHAVVAGDRGEGWLDVG